MKLSKFSNVLNSMYTDKLSITRYTETTNEDGTVDSTLSQIPIYTDIPCRISFNSMDTPESAKEDTNPKNLYIKIFCNTNVDIQKGDEIVVNRIDDDGNTIATYNGTASLPLQYLTHIEFTLLQNGDA